MFQELQEVGVKSDFDDFIGFFDYVIYQFPFNPKNINKIQGVIVIALFFSAVTKQDKWKNIIETLKIGRKYSDLKKEKIYRLTVEHLYIPYFLKTIQEKQLGDFKKFKYYFSTIQPINRMIKAWEKNMKLSC